MSVTFDFDNGSDSGTSTQFSGTTTSLSYTDGGITFTFSTDSSPADVAFVRFNGTSSQPTAPGFEISDSSTVDVFNLTFSSINTGTGTTNVTMRLDGATGTFVIQLTDGSGGAVGSAVTVNSSNGVGTITFGGANGLAFAGITFTSSGGVNNILNVESLTVNCFAAGTAIATPDGQKSIEDLRPGDKLLTADGTETTVKWLGEQKIATRFVHPHKVNPVCITANALADGVPGRDLYLSQDHAIEFDGTLINAGALINGRSIYQVAKMPIDGFSYYHVETDAHEVILAEGCPAESFIDYAGSGAFVNGEERTSVSVTEMDLPRVSSVRLVPRNIRQRLTARASALNVA